LKNIFNAGIRFSRHPLHERNSARANSPSATTTETLSSAKRHVTKVARRIVAVRTRVLGISRKTTAVSNES
jgi:hypothetical protein